MSRGRKAGKASGRVRGALRAETIWPQAIVGGASVPRVTRCGGGSPPRSFGVSWTSALVPGDGEQRKKSGSSRGARRPRLQLSAEEERYSRGALGCGGSARPPDSTTLDCTAENAENAEKMTEKTWPAAPFRFILAFLASLAVAFRLFLLRGLCDLGGEKSSDVDLSDMSDVSEMDDVDDMDEIDEMDEMGEARREPSGEAVIAWPPAIADCQMLNARCQTR